MGKLYCLIGKSGSGKDTIFKKLLSNDELSLLPVVTYTTRPKRDNETDGVEYNFVTKEDVISFQNAGKIIELRQYNTVHGIWYYCTVDDGKINLENGDYLTIATLEGFKGLKRRFGSASVSLYINVEDGERLFRALSRERAQHSPDYNELCRRFLADSEDFSEDRLREAGITMQFENDIIERCVSEIKQFIINQ